MKKSTDWGHCKHQWLYKIYQEQFLDLNLYAYKITRNEVEAEAIIDKSLSIFVSRFMQNADKFPTPAHARAYLKAIVRNACINWFRQNTHVVVKTPVEDIPDNMYITFELKKHDSRKDDLMPQLLLLMDDLPKKLKLVITLFFFEGLSIEQIAQKINRPKVVISVYKTRALIRLREIAVTKNLTPFFD